MSSEIQVLWDPVPHSLLNPPSLPPTLPHPPAARAEPPGTPSRMGHQSAQLHRRGWCRPRASERRTERRPGEARLFGHNRWNLDLETSRCLKILCILYNDARRSCVYYLYTCVKMYVYIYIILCRHMCCICNICVVNICVDYVFVINT